MIPSKRLALVTLIGASSLLATGCTKKIKAEKAEKAIKNNLAAKLKGKKITVECPDGIKAEKGDIFTCTAMVDDHKLVATVTQQDDEGTISWEITEGLGELTIAPNSAKLLQTYVANNLGVADAVITCPDTIEVGKGKEFECTTVIDGVTVTATVQQQDDQGNVTYGLTGGVILSDKLSILIQGALKAKEIDATIDCGPPLHVSKPGGTFQCQAVDPNGKKATIDIKINDDKGNVDWEIASVE